MIIKVPDCRYVKIHYAVKVNELGGPLAGISGCEFEGYEIHMGETKAGEEKNLDVVVSGANPNVYGSYVHGLFDKGNIAEAIIRTLAERKGIVLQDGVFEDYQTYKEKQYDRLADTLRQYLNMEEIYEMLGESHLE